MRPALPPPIDTTSSELCQSSFKISATRGQKRSSPSPHTASSVPHKRFLVNATNLGDDLSKHTLFPAQKIDFFSIYQKVLKKDNCTKALELESSYKDIRVLAFDFDDTLYDLKNGKLINENKLIPLLRIFALLQMPLYICTARSQIIDCGGSAFYSYEKLKSEEGGPYIHEGDFTDEHGNVVYKYKRNQSSPTMRNSIYSYAQNITRKVFPHTDPSVQNSPRVHVTYCNLVKQQAAKLTGEGAFPVMIYYPSRAAVDRSDKPISKKEGLLSIQRKTNVQADQLIIFDDKEYYMQGADCLKVDITNSSNQEGEMCNDLVATLERIALAILNNRNSASDKEKVDTAKALLTQYYIEHYVNSGKESDFASLNSTLPNLAPSA